MSANTPSPQDNTHAKTLALEDERFNKSPASKLQRILSSLQAINPLRAGTWRQKIGRWFALILAVFLLSQAYLLFTVSYYSLFNPSSSAIMRNQARLLAAEEPPKSIRYTWVDYDNISESMKRAVIASEDSNFLAHSGVEWGAILDAYRYNRQQQAKGKNKRRGGSTITQQLAKNLFLSHDRSYIRKGQELIITYMLEGLMSKQRILELYLNVAQFGPTVFGVEQASQVYYKKPASRLSTREAARLAALLPNPTRYSRQLNSRFINTRTNTISQRMRLVTPP